jgi:superoxide oxidase
VSAHAEKKDSAEPTVSLEYYDRVLQTAHWFTLVLIAGAFIVVWASHNAATKEQQTFLLQLHRSLGVTVFALTLFRLAWRWHARIPKLPADLPAIQKLAARVTEHVLYALMLVQPILGILHVNARGRRVDLYLLGTLSPIVGPDKILARQTIAAHELVAYVLLAVIALHACAALFHHFVRRDDVLNAMLPRWRR